MSCPQCCGLERQFDDAHAQTNLRKYRRKGPAKATRWLLGAVADDGVEGRTFIDIGGGVGAVQHDLMERGAAGGTHSDASPAFLRAARSEAEARGYADRIRYLDGDFVAKAHELAPADIVTLDRVVCCYPDMPALLGAAAPLARRTLGLVLPRGGPLARFGVRLVNFVQSLRRHPFRVFAHDPAAVEAVVGSYGLAKRFERDGLVWRVVVFTRREDDARTSAGADCSAPR